MVSSRIFLLVLAMELAALHLSQQEECQSEVVVTSQANLKKQIKKQIRAEIHSAFQSFSGAANLSIPNAPSTGAEQLVAHIDNKLDSITEKLDALEKRINILHELGQTKCHAASSCAEILRSDPDSPSGYYWVTNAMGHPHSVYCDMTRSCGGVTGGWMRVAYLDMTNSSHQCPSGLRQRTDSGVRSCAAVSDSATCSSVQHQSHGIRYSRVCGRVNGYQQTSADGFFTSQRHTIDSYYVDGVSLTYGNSPRHHIWTFAAVWGCRTIPSPPAFVNNDYFYDHAPRGNSINLSNPLWDGEGCGSSTCCTHNNPPWFHKQLPQPTTDDIEMRVCRDQHRGDEDVAIKLVEIFIQ